MGKIKIQGALLFAVMMILFGFTQRTFAQSVSGWKEMVVGLSPNDHTAFEYLLPVITSITGISYQGFCEEHKCLLILFDPAVYTEEQRLTDAFAEKKIKIFPKANTTFKMITAECTIATPQTIDKE